ncbi:MAG: M50 family metallopeptidase [Clostridia bacterium]|nr:M50 family metallopeptidase [Clostridia bacterium]
MWPILLAILFFAMIITIHEFGHFFTAKLFRIKVNEFSIGMGPAILKKKKGETQYSLRILPIGGYCAMEGEDGDSEDQNAFGKKAAWKRFIVVAAGAAMNILLGIIFVTVIVCMDDLIPTPQINYFYENAYSEAGGLQEKDVILKVNGSRVFTTRDLSYELARDKDAVYDFVVRRDGVKVNVDGVAFQTVETEDGKTDIVYDFTVVGVKKTFFNVIGSSLKESYSIARIVWKSLFDLVTGRYGLHDLSGPIGTIKIIANAASEAASDSHQGSIIGLETLINIMAFISINLGVFNLLPIPALDGGRLFFILCEMIRRKPILPKYEKYVHAAGMVLLLLLMAVVSVNDIINLIRG